MWIFLTGLSNDIVSLMGPYSWMFCSICNAYADWGRCVHDVLWSGFGLFGLCMICTGFAC